MSIAWESIGNCLNLSQLSYISQVLQHFPNFTTLRPSSAPLPIDRAFSQISAPKVSSYQELVGCLMWIADCTRPDISYTASYLGRFSSDLSEADWHLALRTLSYLSNTKEYALSIGGQLCRLATYVDTDWGGCLVTRRSTTGYSSYLHESPVSWCSKR